MSFAPQYKIRGSIKADQDTNARHQFSGQEIHLSAKSHQTASDFNADESLNIYLGTDASLAEDGLYFAEKTTGKLKLLAPPANSSTDADANATRKLLSYEDSKLEWRDAEQAVMLCLGMIAVNAGTSETRVAHDTPNLIENDAMSATGDGMAYNGAYVNNATFGGTSDKLAFKAPNTGVYQFNIQVDCNNVHIDSSGNQLFPNVSGSRTVRLVKSDSDNFGTSTVVSDLTVQPNPDSDIDTRLNLICQAKLTQGHYAAIQVEQNSGSTLTFKPQRFEAHYVCDSTTANPEPPNQS